LNAIKIKQTHPLENKFSIYVYLLIILFLFLYSVFFDFFFLDNLKRTLQISIEEFYRQYGSNKLIDLSIYNDDGSTIVLENIMIAYVDTYGLGKVKIIINNKINNDNKLPIFRNRSSHYIYNIIYNDGENDINASNMVYIHDFT